MQSQPSSDLVSADADEAARIDAIAFTADLAGHWNARLGPELLGAYLIGSLAHGGFSRRYSDIDVALIMRDGLPAMAQDQMRHEAMAISPHLAAKLSLFWSDRGFANGRLPLLDRVDYVDHAIPLVERNRVLPDRPSIEEIRGYLAGEPLLKWTASVQHLAALETLGPRDHKSYLRALLYPARFIYSWMTGRMASNDTAVAFVSEQPVPGLDIELIERALQFRRTARDPDPLFSARTGLWRQVDVCTRLTGQAP
jgi:predicted nucleotidyltransferase